MPRSAHNTVFPNALAANSVASSAVSLESSSVGVHLDHLHRPEQLAFCQQLHREVCLAVGHPAPNGRADSRCLLGVEPVHVETGVDAVDAVASDLEGIVDDRPNPAFVDVGHRVDGHVRVRQHPSLGVVDRPEPDDHDVLLAQSWRIRPLDARELPDPERGRQRHPVDVPRR